MGVSKGMIHVVIGDTQVKEGVPTDNLRWIGQYIVDQFAGQDDVRLIHLGDHADMPSLSSWDKGKKSMEGRRYRTDIEAANDGWAALNKPLVDYNKARRKSGKKMWQPKSKTFTRGNHEERIEWAVEGDPQLEGVLSFDDLNIAEYGWDVHPFREIVWLDGVAYSHFFYNPYTGKPYGGENIQTRLKTIGHSFTMGHQQGRKYGDRFVGKASQHGLVLGSSYLHDEKYMGPQGHEYWRGIVVCHQVENGSYDPMMVSLEYLCRRYEGVTLQEFMKRWKKRQESS